MQPALPRIAMNAAAIQPLVPELFRVIAELEAAVPGSALLFRVVHRHLSVLHSLMPPPWCAQYRE